MKKAWFKHRYGYINMDEEYIYFTHTGNWQETRTQLSKKKEFKFVNSLNQFFPIYVRSIISVLLLLSFFFIIEINTIAILGFIGIIAALTIVNQIKPFFANIPVGYIKLTDGFRVNVEANDRLLFSFERDNKEEEFYVLFNDEKEIENLIRFAQQITTQSSSQT